jgi:hypothetical protein
VQPAGGQTIEARTVVLPTGRVMPDIGPDTLKDLGELALATPPQRHELLWPRGAPIWRMPIPILACAPGGRPA